MLHPYEEDFCPEWGLVVSASTLPWVFTSPSPAQTFSELQTDRPASYLLEGPQARRCQYCPRINVFQANPLSSASAPDHLVDSVTFYPLTQARNRSRLRLLCLLPLCLSIPDRGGHESRQVTVGRPLPVSLCLCLNPGSLESSNSQRLFIVLPFSSESKDLPK